MNSREVIERLFAAYAMRDVPAMVDCLHPDVEWTEAAGFPYAGTYVGPEAIRVQVWGRMGSEWSGWLAVHDSMVVEGDRVAVTGTYTGRFRASGKSIEARFAHVYEVRDGKVFRMEQFVDSAAVNEALA